MPASTVSPEVRAAALADLAAGEQPAIVAARYGLNRNTVKSWAVRLGSILGTADAAAASAHALDAPAAPAAPIGSIEARKQRIAELILDLLAAKLEGSRRLAAHLSDPAFLAGQSLADLIALSSYLDRSALTLGDRLAGPGESRGPEPGDEPPELP